MARAGGTMMTKVGVLADVDLDGEDWTEGQYHMWMQMQAVLRSLVGLVVTEWVSPVRWICSLERSLMRYERFVGSKCQHREWPCPS